MPTVLVVEDEAAIAELIALNLRHAGFEVTLAETADQASAAIAAELPDHCRSLSKGATPRDNTKSKAPGSFRSSARL